MSAPRKTIDVSVLGLKVNAMLANSDGSKVEGREALGVLIDELSPCSRSSGASTYPPHSKPPNASCGTTYANDTEVLIAKD